MEKDAQVVEAFIKHNIADASAMVNIATGLVFCFVGHRCYRVMIGFITCLYVGALICYVGTELTYHAKLSENAHWVVLVLAIMVGGLAGAALCFKELQFASVFLLGGFLSCITAWSAIRASEIIYAYNVDHEYELLTLALASLGGGFLGLPPALNNAVVLLATSFGGAWMTLCIGVDHFVSDSFTIQKMFLIDEVWCGKSCQYFMVGSAVLGLAGLLVQLLVTKKKETLDDFIDRRAAKKVKFPASTLVHDGMADDEETSGLLIRPEDSFVTSPHKSRSVRDIVKNLVSHASKKRLGTHDRVDYENLTVTVKDKYGISGVKNNHGAGKLVVEP